MKKVITYGTYDLLHKGHIALLQRAKALGDYLIVGVTSDSFDKARGKINVSQTLSERIEAVKATGLADEIIVEEYEGQKIDDIKRYGVDIFTVGSDWKGKFDYLKKYCQVVYLDRTKGISSSQIRSESRRLRVGLIGDPRFLNKVIKEARYVNGMDLVAFAAEGLWESMDEEQLRQLLPDPLNQIDCVTRSYDDMLELVDAVYIMSAPELHGAQVRRALEAGKHVLCAAPISLSCQEFEELQALAAQRHLVLMDGLKTAFSMAYSRLLLLVKTGIIGDVVSVDATCTSLREPTSDQKAWNSICAWGPTAMLPVFQLLGPDFKDKSIVSRMEDKRLHRDLYTRVNFRYPDAVASISVGTGVKSEGELIISGTKGYVFVPAPWWKTDYFEVRFENPQDNKRYFYQLDGEGIRFELVYFVRSTNQDPQELYVERETSLATIHVIQDFYEGKDCAYI